MLGLTRKQARERFDEIIAFAELEEFLDLKLKNYSSGMAVRLGFAVAIQVDADILLVDEVLAVGDAAFQQKCFEQFATLKAAGKTIVFVTHDMSAVERFCDRAMLLERGELVALGAPSEVARALQPAQLRRRRPRRHRGRAPRRPGRRRDHRGVVRGLRAQAPDRDAAGRVLPRLRRDDASTRTCRTRSSPGACATRAGLAVMNSTTFHSTTR